MPPKRKATTKLATSNAATASPLKKKARQSGTDKENKTQTAPAPKAPPKSKEVVVELTDSEPEDDDERSDTGDEDLQDIKDPDVRARMKYIKDNLLNGNMSKIFLQSIIHSLHGYMGQRNGTNADIAIDIVNHCYSSAAMGRTCLVEEFRAVKNAYGACWGGCGYGDEEDGDEDELLLDPDEGNNKLSEAEGEQLDECKIPRDFQKRLDWCAARLSRGLSEDSLRKLLVEIPALPTQKVDEDDDDAGGMLMDNFDERCDRGYNLVKEALLIYEAEKEEWVAYEAEKAQAKGI